MIKGILVNTLFQDTKTGFGVFSLINDDEKEVIIKGTLPLFGRFVPLLLEGELVHEEKGDAYNFSSARFYSDDQKTVKAFLENITNPKLSDKMISEILKYCRTPFFENLNDLSNYPDKLRKTHTFQRLIDKILQWKKIMEWQVIYKNFPLLFFQRLINKYSLNKAEETFEKNIYQVGMDLGLTFHQCDQIAKSKNKNYYETDRILGAYKYVMYVVISNGHTFAYLDDFLLFLQKVLGEPKISITYLYTLKPDWLVVDFEREKPIIFDIKYFNIEKSIARNITRLSLSPKEEFKQEYFDEAEKECNIKCGKEQKLAISNMCKKRGVKILTGNPGTGKTTSINVFMHIYQKMHPDHTIVLCAPTGRAAQRMQESTDYPSSTIHHLLQYYTDGDHNLCKDENNPIVANLLIVDEMSMVDVELFDLLLRAVKNDTSIVLVGDPNQLESVGPGRVLSDLIDSNLIEHYHLKEVFRQKEESLIINNAIRINNGIEEIKTGDDFKVFLGSSEEQISDFVQKVCKKYKDIQVMSPIKGGIAGVHEMNKKLQEVLNANKTKFVQYGDTVYYIGDKVIMTSNQPKMNFYNGDLGIITDINNNTIKIQFPTKSIELTPEYFSEMDLAYSITIHKSQGSEFPTVLIILPYNERSKCLLRRNLLYTAVTRCKQKTIIVAQKKDEDNALYHCIRNLSRVRNGRLLECLQNTNKVS